MIITGRSDGPFRLACGLVVTLLGVIIFVTSVSHQ
ncbi:hypothetical protein L916_01448, partial [Phytophthora nicotianae]